MKKVFNAVLIIITILYSIWYAGLGGFVGNKGALSKIGLEHPVLFAVWGILTYFSLAYSITLGFRKTKYKFYIPLLILSFVGMVLTLTCEFDYANHTQYVLHCIGSLGFSIITGTCVFLLFLVSRARVLPVACGIILITDLVLLIIFKETAIIELFPIISGYILLYIFNHIREKSKVEIKR